MKIENVIIEIFHNPEIIQNYRNLVKVYEKNNEMKEKIEKVLQKRINAESNN